MNYTRAIEQFEKLEKEVWAILQYHRFDEHNLTSVYRQCDDLIDDYFTSKALTKRKNQLLEVKRDTAPYNETEKMKALRVFIRDIITHLKNNHTEEPETGREEKVVTLQEEIGNAIEELKSLRMKCQIRMKAPRVTDGQVNRLFEQVEYIVQEHLARHPNNIISELTTLKINASKISGQNKIELLALFVQQVIETLEKQLHLNQDEDRKRQIEKYQLEKLKATERKMKGVEGNMVEVNAEVQKARQMANELQAQVGTINTDFRALHHSFLKRTKQLNAVIGAFISYIVLTIGYITKANVWVVGGIGLVTIVFYSSLYFDWLWWRNPKVKEWASKFVMDFSVKFAVAAAIAALGYVLYIKFGIKIKPE
jgi:hypothetical protein